MHKCVLKPLKSVIEAVLHDFQVSHCLLAAAGRGQSELWVTSGFVLLQVSSGAWQQLRENLALAKTKRPEEMGVDGAVPPDSVAIEKIRQKFLNMRTVYSPEKKVSLLLRVCKLIYTIMQDHSGTETSLACLQSNGPVPPGRRSQRLTLRVLPGRADVRGGRLPAHADVRGGSVRHAAARRRDPVHDGAAGPVSAPRRR